MMTRHSGLQIRDKPVLHPSSHLSASVGFALDRSPERDDEDDLTFVRASCNNYTLALPRIDKASDTDTRKCHHIILNHGSPERFKGR